jgi:hypothetical protein
MISVPTEGRPTTYTSSEDLIGIDGNAFSIMGTTKQILQRAGASKGFRDSYLKDAMSGDYDHLIAVSVAYLDCSEE